MIMGNRTLKPVPMTPILERAIALAATGKFRTFAQIEIALSAEGYSRGDRHLAGRATRDHLLALSNRSRAGIDPEDETGV